MYKSSNSAVVSADPSSLWQVPTGYSAHPVRLQITADAGFTPKVMIDLGRAALSLSSGEIQTMTLPVAISNEGGVSYVVPVEPDATSVLNAFIAGTVFPEL